MSTSEPMYMSESRLIPITLSTDELRTLVAWLGRMQLSDLDSVHATESDIAHCWRAISRILEVSHAQISR